VEIDIGMKNEFGSRDSIKQHASQCKTNQKVLFRKEISKTSETFKAKHFL